MLLNKKDTEQFKTDWNELTTQELCNKYNTHKKAVLSKGKELGLPNKYYGWWSQSKIERFKIIFSMSTIENLKFEFECDYTTINKHAKQLGLKP